MAKIIADGLETEVEGVLPTPGGVAPVLNLTDEELREVTLETYAGKKKVLNIFPSVDTPTCAASVRKFNAAASQYPDTVVLCISADLPFAQSRFCGAAGLDNVISLSTFRHPEFLRNWGVLLATGALQGLAARAVVVLDEQDEVCYSELVNNLSDEPDYEAALAAL